MRERVLLGDVAAGLADNDDDLTFVIELCGHRGTNDGFAVADKGSREADEQGRICGRL